MCSHCLKDWIPVIETHRKNYAVKKGEAVFKERFFANELQESEKRMRNLVHMPVKGRVAQALISLKNKFGINAGGFIDIDLSRQDLAAFTGVAYESLFRTINDLVEEKVIEIAGKSIHIKNEALLLKLTEEA